jgi:hypothetical protein
MMPKIRCFSSISTCSVAICTVDDVTVTDVTAFETFSRMSLTNAYSPCASVTGGETQSSNPFAPMVTRYGPPAFRPLKANTPSASEVAVARRSGPFNTTFAWPIRSPFVSVTVPEMAPPG